MIRFELHRDVDPSGISGTGMVAWGVEFPNGKCALAWATEVQSVAVYDSIGDVQKIHGHSGLTRILWVDDDDQE
jgi:hypothetical protein